MAWTKEKQAAYNKVYYETHKNEIAAYNKVYYAKKKLEKQNKEN